jgi:hypothetical protein
VISKVKNIHSSTLPVIGFMLFFRRKKPMHNVRDNNSIFHHIHVAEEEVEEEKGSC